MMDELFDDNSDVAQERVIFPVKITDKEQDVETLIWYYSWTEQSFDPENGVYEDAPSPREGDFDDGPFLIELNNLEVTLPCFAWVRLKGIVESDPLYEFDCGAGGGGGGGGGNIALISGGIGDLYYPAFLVSGSALTPGTAISVLTANGWELANGIYVDVVATGEVDVDDFPIYVATDGGYTGAIDIVVDVTCSEELGIIVTKNAFQFVNGHLINVT